MGAGSPSPLDPRCKWSMNKKEELKKHAPLKSGTAFHTEIGPHDANCPNAISSKNNGSPAVTNMMT